MVINKFNLLEKKAPKKVPKKAPKKVPKKAPKKVPKKAPKKVPKKAPIEKSRVFRWEPFLVPFFQK